MSRNPYSPQSPGSPTSPYGTPSSPLSLQSSLYSPSSNSYPQYSPGLGGLNSPISQRSIISPGGYISAQTPQAPHTISSPMMSSVSTPMVAGVHAQEYIPQVVMDDILLAYYTCGECGTDVTLKIGKEGSDAVACPECAERILYKKRSNIPMQYEAR